MKRRIALLLAVALVGGLLAAGCAPKPPPGKVGKFGGIWYDALGTNPPHLDPVFATDTTSAEVGYQMFEALVELDPEGNIVPLLAEKWEIKDGQVFTFKLRKGVHFHKTIEGGQPTANGGREVTAEDWVWTFNFICNPDVNSPRSYFVDMIKGWKDYQEKKVDKLPGVKAVDKYTLQIELEYPFMTFLSILAYNTFVALPKEDVEKWGKDFNFHPVGTGAFKFEKWLQDDKVVLSKNENYWMKDAAGNRLPYLDGIEFRIIPDHAVEWTEFKLGNIYQSYVDDPVFEECKRLYKDSFFERATLGTYYYGMNVTMEPFKNNKKLRQALNYAIDRRALVDLVRLGRAIPAKGVLPPGMFAYNPDLKGYDYNPDKARQLLTEAGYPNGIDLTIQINDTPGHKRIFEALQAQYAKVGIRLTAKYVDWGAHLDSLDRGEVPFFRLGWVADYADPDNFLYVLLHKDTWGPGGNASFFSHPETDQILLAARRESNQEKRKEMYQKAEQIIVDEAPWVFIYHYTTHSCVQPFVKNYVLPSFGQYTNKFRDVWIEK